MGIIKGKMAACVQRINYVKSYYMWEGKFMQEEEKILLIKLSEDSKEKILTYIKKNHPYEIPELVWIKPEDVGEAYAKRVEASRQ
jgi:periplasmic divalent cation tolerance protein